ncbi:ATP-grasp domain-containing protein [Cryobacterium psychrophilum]|uniref:ATP-grasp domain-containing protein n=1 Tax=Cryobacterium psychrophilum TaxID=41988 RepID=A0A4Y8KS10_9MICO|nr:ATP-grasp domain-containing protein [Cryobacterium psychrophilum]TDW29391.1 ATP-grasp domain-containing protein [Cryobacterium psychrophilum]TFD81463.1 ATP-grasp domain-containing protein [Cryobacterium psychrophilum]
MSRNIFVLGLDELNLSTLLRLADADQYDFHQLLTRRELQTGTVSVPELLDKARRQLDSFDGSIDAIMGYWDFPVSMMVPILCTHYGLPSAGLEAVLKCEHKYWSRLEQRKVIDEYVPFGLLDLTDDNPTLPAPLSYPVWIKPIKSTASQGALYVENDEQLRDSLDEERQVVDRIGGPFAEVLALVDLPAEIAAVGVQTCLVEEAATGQQVTVEGFSRGGRVEIYGVVDSVSYSGESSFLRYQYPSRLVPEHTLDYMGEVSRRVITALGLNNSTFNIEYFWDRVTERISLLEINARHSQSHALLFELVDGVANHAYMLDLALDRDPRRVELGKGAFPLAAKWFLRRFSNGLVRRVPTREEVAEIEGRIMGTTVCVTAPEGTRLSELDGEDSYSYVLAEIYTGGRDEQELSDKYTQCVEALNFTIDD